MLELMQNFLLLFSSGGGDFRFLQNTSDNETVTNVSDPCEDVDGDDSLGYAIAINILVWFTVWGISSVVDFEEFKSSFKKPPIYAGATFQFFFMPFIGFMTVVIFNGVFSDLDAITLLILTASPGGSFSNWWCNLFNADLALSVSMTSLSTLCSIGMLPLNIVIYVTLAYTKLQSGVDDGADEVEVEFADLGLTLGIVISAIFAGILTGAYLPQYQQITNVIGNVAGFSSIALGVFASTDTCDGQQPWERGFDFWVACAFPLIIALGGVVLMATCMGLEKPQRVAIALETAYQNQSIALAYALSQGAAGRTAAAVPVMYGGFEAGLFGLFMLGSWKIGWTYAPSNDPMWKVMFDSYQPGGENHKRLFPGYYNMKPEAEEFNKSVKESFRKSFDGLRRTLSLDGADDAKEVEVEAEEQKKDEASTVSQSL